MQTPQQILSLLILAQEERRLLQQNHLVEINSLTPAIEAMQEIVDYMEAQQTVMTIVPKEAPEPVAPVVPPVPEAPIPEVPVIEPVPPPSDDPVPSEADTHAKPKKK